MTDYFPIMTKLRTTMEENIELIENESFSYFQEILGNERQQMKHLKSVPSRNASDFGKVLDMLLEASKKNKYKFSKGNRYNQTLKKMALWIFAVGGHTLYETLYKNMKGSIPSVRTMQRFLLSEDLTEGVVRIAALKEFLVKRNYPLRVFLSEDQTSVTGRIQYDTRSNNLVGFVLPLKNGLPVLNHFKATTASHMEKIFQSATPATYLYAIMAQPLVNNAPAFCLCIFGSDSKFTHDDILKRWTFIEKLASDYGINIEGFSSDGDPRLLKAMRLKSNMFARNERLILHESENIPWFRANFTTAEPLCFQDTVHIGTKMKTRLLKPSILLPIGKYLISATFLRDLIQKVGKDKHLLTEQDLNNEDKMNFRSVEKITSAEVQTLLSEKIPNSEGLVMYLKVTKLVLDAFLSKSLSPLDRIYNIWYSVFILRQWRYWLKKQGYTITNNFITLNCYLCIELNAHSLVLAILKHKEEGYSPETFTPWYFSSQPCEKTFRATRSMTSTWSTVTNFSILDVIRRLNRIQSINDIVSDIGINLPFLSTAKTFII